ncbi:MAG: class I adenylate cyclase [gamma proteobacterium symbiont of Taylorina sp.]|nr:class I adenylate cyclase [gamma proteobacterium symbiont of Taylorina sp.]
MTLKKHSNVDQKFNLENFNQKKILQKFLKVNDIRLQRTQDAVSRRQAEFLQVLPLLFHINHPLLPGFVSSQCPTGISQYHPDNETLLCARRLSKSFEHKNRAYQRYDIHALYMMGSTGTIAYSDKSDFDIWLCHREDLNAIELKELNQKALNIAHWCKDFNLEVNFFLINTEHFRHGEIDELSSESSGSTQHNLLLEEFYRTSMLIAGRYPLWWIVPPQYEKNYDEYIQHIIHQRHINENNYLNFGSMANVPAEEFYGATLWHIYKGIDSPYKSILKLLLMESYAKEYPDINLLSLSYKKIIYQQDKPDINQLDPYIMLINKITKHLVEEESFKRLELARRCFYLKVNTPLSKVKTLITRKTLVPSWRQKIMSEMIENWSWEQHHILLLDERNHWKFDEFSKEHRDILDALTYSYRQLSDIFRYQKEDIRINKRDLHILGRKLYAAFEKKAGKIEIINHDKSIDLIEQHISLHPISIGHAKNTKKKLSTHKHGWSLYLGAVNQLKQSVTPIKKSSHLLKLLSWAYFNQLISSRSNFILAQQIQVLTNNELKHIIQSLEHIFPDASLGYATINELIKPAQLGSNLLVLNIGIDPFLQKHLHGSQITTSRTDTLNFGAMHENLLMSIDQVFFTSWREVIHNHFKEENGLMECLCQYLKWNYNPKNKSARLILPTLICCYSSVRSEAISSRIKQLFNDVLNSFYHFHQTYIENNKTQKNRPVFRYLISVRESFYLLWHDDNGAKYQKISDHRELIRELSYPLNRFNSLIIDKQFSGSKVVSLIFEKNKENHVQLFYQNHNKTADIYIIDEWGGLYHQKVSIEKDSIHINHFMLFLDSIIKRICLNNSRCDLFQDVFDMTSTLTPDNMNEFDNELDDDNSTTDMQLEVFEIVTKTPQNLLLKDKFSRLQGMPAHFFRIQVIADLDDKGKRLYIIYANDKEFSSFEYGQKLYKKVAEEIVCTRQNRQRYPIYITDIDLSETLIEAEGSQSIQITQLLKFKYEIERRLNQAIKNLN